MKRIVKGCQEEYAWAIDLSKALSACIFSFLIGGASVSLGYSEVIYMLVMLTEILNREVANQIKNGPEIKGSLNFNQVGRQS